MRVALLSPLFESVPPKLYGGTERVVYNLCRGLTEANIEVTLFGSADSVTEGKLVPVIDEALRLRNPPVAEPSFYVFRMLSMIAQRAHEFDVIHNHNDYWMLPLTEMTRTPVLTTLHGRLDLPDLKHVLSGFPKAQYVSISDSQRQPVPGLPWARTIHHGIDVQALKFHEKPGKYLAFLGRIDAEKRPDWAIEIAKRSGVPLKIAAKIEGKKGEDYFNTAIKPHIDGKFIEFIGEISEAEKSDFLGQALALTFPIDWPEPFGLVVIEALACGTPVLTRPCGSMPELLREGVTGFSHLDVTLLAERVRDIPKLNRAKCREWVQQRFSLERMAEDYIHVYRRIAELAERTRTGKAYGADSYRRNFLYPLQRVADGDS
ncbi:MAG TPA: glycosyltransferase family 4 protein [Bdellovibrionota bacterium]|nr:glycosyltransferase family 4 protein [Bdellovibrionota bacterium]